MPAYNEENRIKQVIESCLPFLDTLVIVDDGSRDDTYKNSCEITDVTVLRHSINRGQGAALRTGTKAALNLGADLIIHLDADGQHDASQIPVLIEPIARGEADIVFGSRFMGIKSEGMPASRRALLMAGRWFNTFVQGIPRAVTDPQSGFRALNREAAESLNFNQDRMAHASEILKLATRSKLRWAEVPVKIIYTEDSLKKGQKNTDALKIAWQLLLGIFTKQ